MRDVLTAEPMFITVIAGPYGANDLSSWVQETSLVSMTRDVVIGYVRDGHYDDVWRIIGINLKTGTSWDATKEIALEVESRLPPEGQRNTWEDTVAMWCRQKLTRSETA